ncbi:MAG: YceI family protein [Candidatus Eremiobacteraeota bacterium]|nr:YceI family protein [Candidatus Eremiobacteraeota bacterium]MCW5866381.1 YceI family protein [Candidatus Eremiobacteraeota bacterium]
MFKQSLVSLALGATLALSAWSEPASYKVDPAHSSVVFNIRHLVSQVEGRFRDFQGSIDYDQKDPRNSKVSFTVKADSIFTDNEKRDAHLKGDDFFAVDKYPNLTFQSKKVSPRGPNKLDVLGTLTIHGVSKDVLVPVQVLGIGPGFQGEVAGFRSDFTINRKDFGIVWNSKLDKGGSVLGEDVEVRLLVEAGKQ